MKKTVSVFFILVSFQINSQSNFEQFLKLSAPKKTWVLVHPFKAKKALKISKEAKRISDSIKQTDVLDKNASGGQVDAFRHAFWMARLRQEIGKSAARSLGRAHEKENYLMFKKSALEDGYIPDEVSSKMDLYNNEEGLKLIKKGSKIPKIGLIYRVINAILQGKMKIIKKNKNQQFLTCDGKIITKASLKGKWKNNKCLIDSN